MRQDGFGQVWASGWDIENWYISQSTLWQRGLASKWILHRIWDGSDFMLLHRYQCQHPCAVTVRENGKCMHWHKICNKVKFQFEFEVTTEWAHLLAHFLRIVLTEVTVAIRKDVHHVVWWNFAANQLLRCENIARESWIRPKGWSESLPELFYL